MKLIDKIKSAIFEDDEFDKNEDEIVKKIDVEKTTKEEKVKEKVVPPFESVHREEIKKPIIFSDEDFEMEEEKPLFEFKEEKKPEIKKEVSKPLYGGYGLKEEMKKDKFQPSPVLSPVYGIMDKEDLERQHKPSKSLESLFKEEKKPEVTFDTIRQKAYGEIIEEKEDEKELFFEMEKDDVPGVEKVTIGDAEEYYQDLGLEYNIDYKDKDKEKKTRIKKNKELSEIVDEEIKENKKIEEEIGKKSSKKKVDIEEVEEKNLYDLIDMMYDSKE